MAKVSKGLSSRLVPNFTWLFVLSANDGYFLVLFFGDLVLMAISGASILS
jgi:hypothetical protein